MPSACTFPGCGRPAVGRSLCAAHFRQRARAEAAGDHDRPLRPLRGQRGLKGIEPLVRLPGMRGPERVADAMRRNKAGALGALVKWTDEQEKERKR